MKLEQPDYVAYLLRLWRVNDNGESHQAIWRASLENPHTGERQGFASLEAVFGFLRAQTGLTRHSPTARYDRLPLDHQKREEAVSSSGSEKQKEIKR